GARAPNASSALAELMLLERGESDAGRAQSVARIKEPELLTHVDDADIRLARRIEPVGCELEDRLIGEAYPVHGVGAAGVFDPVAATGSRTLRALRRGTARGVRPQPGRH